MTDLILLTLLKALLRRESSSSVASTIGAVSSGPRRFSRSIPNRQNCRLDPKGS